MNLKWDITLRDKKVVEKLILENRTNPFVQNRFNKNVLKKCPSVTRDSFLKAHIMCLLTSQQRSGPNSNIALFLNHNPFPLDYEFISKCDDIESEVKSLLENHDLKRFISRVSSFFKYNIELVMSTDWKIIDELNFYLEQNLTRAQEQKIAEDYVEKFKGFGPKQSRNLIQTIGISRFEIPLDSRIMNWLQRIDFPLVINSKLLQDKSYYNLIVDGINSLCKNFDMYPCVFDAMVFSSFDSSDWTDNNIIY